MPPKKTAQSEKSGLSGKIVKWGALATAIAAILTLFWSVFPGWKPPPQPNVLRVEFGELSPEKQSLKEYLATLDRNESKAVASSEGSVGSVGSKPGAPQIRAKATASQSTKVKRSFSEAEINKLGTTFRVSTTFIATAGKKYYLEWSLLDASKSEVYSSKNDFTQEFKITHPLGDGNYSEIWVPTEGHSGVFSVRIQIIDDEKSKVAYKVFDNIQLP